MSDVRMNKNLLCFLRLPEVYSSIIVPGTLLCTKCLCIIFFHTYVPLCQGNVMTVLGIHIHHNGNTQPVLACPTRGGTRYLIDNTRLACGPGMESRKPIMSVVCRV